MKYSDLNTGKTIIHVVGGKLNDDLKANIGNIADWFVKNDITLLWGDDYKEKDNPEHPVALLEKEIRARGGNLPIRCLTIGEYYYELSKEHLHDPKQFEPVYDDSDAVIGYHAVSDDEYCLIYSVQQQDRQKAYYNEADALMVLDGGLGAAYEIPSAFLYTLSGDVAGWFKLMVIDDPKSKKFGKLIDSYLACGGCTKEQFPQIEYFESAKEFVKTKKKEEQEVNE